MISQWRLDEADQSIIEYVKNGIHDTSDTMNLEWWLKYIQKKASKDVYEKFVNDIILKLTKEDCSVWNIRSWSDDFSKILEIHKEACNETITWLLDSVFVFTRLEKLLNIVYWEEITLERETRVKKFFDIVINKELYDTAEKILDHEVWSYLFNEDDKKIIIQWKFDFWNNGKNVGNYTNAAEIYMEYPNIVSWAWFPEV